MNKSRGRNRQTFRKPEKTVEESLEKLKQECEFEFYKSSGPGGQRKNKRETAVRLRHTPTGIVVHATESRSQAANMALALKRLQQKIAARSRKRRPRIPTGVPAAVTRRRIADKKHRGALKTLRKISPGDSS
ncbi:MAG: peptide chain release factor-like protein [Candidatus Eremiobacteraeota bacterium]|nr:peptide chain release factor-like protein [Candidatus Eremiobacteraeota bacterium]